MQFEGKPFIFDASILQHQSHIPPQFVWPDHEKPCSEPPPILDVPPIDLGGFLSGDPPEAVSNAARLVDQACRKHGFFLVINHGIDLKLIEEARIDFFFGNPPEEKQKALRKPGDHCGYASSFANRFSYKLSWKEPWKDIVQSYFLELMGEDYMTFGYSSNQYI